MERVTGAGSRRRNTRICWRSPRIVVVRRPLALLVAERALRLELGRGQGGDGVGHANLRLGECGGELIDPGEAAPEVLAPGGGELGERTFGATGVVEAAHLDPVRATGVVDAGGGIALA